MVFKAGDEGFYSFKSSIKNVVRFPMPDNVKDINELTRKQFRNALLKLSREIRAK